MATLRAVDPPTRSGAGPSDAALVLAARAGEEWAKEALFRRHARAVNGLAFRLMGRDADVDDLVQDSFVFAFTRLGSLQDPQAFAAWLRSIAVRTASKVMRKRRLLERLGLRRRGDPIDLDATAARAAGPDVVAELHRTYELLERLPAGERIALVLQRIEGLTLQEVADTMEISLATAKRRLESGERALHHLARREAP